MPNMFPRASHCNHQPLLTAEQHRRQIFKKEQEILHASFVLSLDDASLAVYHMVAFGIELCKPAPNEVNKRHGKWSPFTRDGRAELRRLRKLMKAADNNGGK